MSALRRDCSLCLCACDSVLVLQVGIILAPSVAGVLCSYTKDVTSYNFQCDPPGVSRSCIPGCMPSPGQWAEGAYRGSSGLRPMLENFEVWWPAKL